VSKLLIIGSSGMFGSYFCNFLKKKGIKFSKSHNYKNLRIDLTIKKNVFSSLDSLKPNVIVNLAAMTDIELCEKKEKLAYKTNSTIPKNIMSWIKINKSARLIHFSTDHVYSGNGPHKEKKTKTCNVYAKSKKKGEDALDLSKCLILRTNFFGISKSKKNSLSDWIADSIKKNKYITLYNNVYFNPLSLETLSKILLTLIKKPTYGLYNLGSKNGFSKFKFAKFFIEAINNKYRNFDIINYSNTKSVKRSLDMRMNINMFQKKLNIKLPTLKKEVLKELKFYLKK
jgi:dTDP-4-dehydrorhamnose reductase|tara:strand:- start:3253 stop:4107 length:855 start_codon:yes stop_codon:yes gene_type:complete